VPIRDNRLLRAKKFRESRNKTQAVDNQPTVEEQLAHLEEDLRRLKIEFDIYFNGGAKRPPYDTKNRVETLIKRLGDDRTLNFAQRYHYNSLAARYHSFREMWRRTIQGREEGRDSASAARAQMHAEHSRIEDPSIFVCDDAHKDVQTVRHIFEALVEAKRKCGEPTEDLSFPRFHHLIATKTDKLKENLGCDRVRFSIDVQDGRVSFKAKGE
jgi:hypothetical protein